MRTTPGRSAGLPAGAAAAGLMLALGGCQTTEISREQIVQAPMRCETQAVPIYFAPREARLTPDGRKVLFDAAARARGCAVEKVSVVGLADATGDEAANFELSKRRAAAVSAVLVDAGLPPRELELAAGGEGGATLDDGRADPLRRRTEVTLHLKPAGK